MLKYTRPLAVLALVAAVVGCDSYYRVTEVNTKDEYYYGPGSMKMQDSPSRGYPIAFKDSRTGKTVNVENYTIEKITKAEFNKNVPTTKRSH